VHANQVDPKEDAFFPKGKMDEQFFAFYIRRQSYRRNLVFKKIKLVSNSLLVHFFMLDNGDELDTRSAVSNRISSLTTLVANCMSK